MNKVKKVLTGIGVFFSIVITKVYAIVVAPEPISLYAVDPGPKEHVENFVFKIGKVAIPIVLFLIGFFVVLSKKITKKVKAIVVFALVIVAMLSVVLINYISTNL